MDSKALNAFYTFRIGAKNVGGILGASQQKWKYERLLACVEPRERFSNCKRAKLVYLVPKWKAGAWRTLLNGSATVLSFEDLPEDIDAEFSPEWTIIRRYLLQLDSCPQGSGSGEHDNEGHRNFKATCSYEEVIRLCQLTPDAIMVGFEGGRRKLAAASLDELKTRRSYKWDYADSGTGVKDSRNWISGSEFLEIAQELKGDRSSPRP